MSSSVNLSKMVFDNTNFRVRSARSVTAVPVMAAPPAPAPVSALRRNVNPAFHLSKFISNATNTGSCKACGH